DAPLRATWAFSTSTTSAPSSLARSAAQAPPKPPPITRTSVSITSASINDTLPLLECSLREHLCVIRTRIGSFRNSNALPGAPGPPRRRRENLGAVMRDEASQEPTVQEQIENIGVVYNVV